MTRKQIETILGSAVEWQHESRGRTEFSWRGHWFRVAPDGWVEETNPERTGFVRTDLCALLERLLERVPA